jgi:hypothetical protein
MVMPASLEGPEASCPQVETPTPPAGSALGLGGKASLSDTVLIPGWCLKPRS